MTPFHFGPAEAPLFGSYAPPRPSVARKAGVLLCAPIGLEYLRTHYAIRLLALQLADRGFHVLRFDYHGTGDSSCDIGAGQFDVWLDDIVIAARELADLSGVAEPAVVGLRMGAALALKAASSREQKWKGVVLWDPVVSGHEYLSSIAEMNSQMAADRKLPPRETDELLGARYPEDLRRAIQDINLLNLVEVPDVSDAALVTSEERPEYSALLKAIQNRWPDAAYRSMEDPVNWTSLKAAFDARMTGPIVRAVAEAVERVA